MGYTTLAIFTGIFRLVVILVQIALVVLSIVFRKRLGRAFLFVLLGFAAMLLASLVAVLFPLLASGPVSYRVTLLGENALSGVLDVAALVLLAIGLFVATARRAPEPPPVPYYGTQPGPAQRGPFGPPPPPPAQPRPEGSTPLWPGTPPN